MVEVEEEDLSIMVVIEITILLCLLDKVTFICNNSNKCLNNNSKVIIWDIENQDFLIIHLIKAILECQRVSNDRMLNKFNNFLLD